MKLQVGLEWNMNSPDRESMIGMSADKCEYEAVFRCLHGLGTAMFENLKDQPCVVEAWVDVSENDLNKYGSMTEKQWELSGKPTVEFCETWSDEDHAGIRLTIAGIDGYEGFEYGLGGHWLGAFHAGTFPDSIEMKVLKD